MKRSCSYHHKDRQRSEFSTAFRLVARAAQAVAGQKDEGSDLDSWSMSPKTSVGHHPQVIRDIPASLGRIVVVASHSGVVVMKPLRQFASNRAQRIRRQCASK